MNKHPDNAKTEKLSAYLDGQLDDAERLAFESELDRDPDLQSLLEQWKSLGDAFRGLPQRSLPADFSDRVMARIDAQSLVGVASATSDLAEVGSKRPSTAASQRWAFGLIGSLATLLLLTLALTPQWMNDRTSQATDPNPTPVTPADEPDSNPTIDPSLSQPQKVSVPEPTANVPINKRRVFVDRPLAMSISRQKSDSGIVESVVPIIEQVLIFDFVDPADRHLDDIIAKLKSDSNNSLRILKTADPVLKSLLPVRAIEGSEKPSQAMLVVTTNSRMKNAIEQLQSKIKVSVRAISLIASDGSKENSAPVLESSAQAVPVFDLLVEDDNNIDDRNELDPQEAEMLDRWFGLSSEDEEPLHQFLILVK